MSTDPADEAPHDGWEWIDDRAEPDPLGDPRVQAGMEHLQRAAREVISAGRALLDAAEDLVDDPRAAAGVLEALASLAERGRSAARPAAPDPDEDDGGTVQRIPVS